MPAMSNVKYKVIYSLRVHLALQERGFNFETEMKNQKRPQFNCWVYKETPEFLEAFDEVNKIGGKDNGSR